MPVVHYYNIYGTVVVQLPSFLFLPPFSRILILSFQCYARARALCIEKRPGRKGWGWGRGKKLSAHTSLHIKDAFHTRRKGAGNTHTHTCSGEASQKGRKIFASLCANFRKRRCIKIAKKIEHSILIYLARFFCFSRASLGNTRTGFILSPFFVRGTHTHTLSPHFTLMHLMRPQSCNKSPSKKRRGEGRGRVVSPPAISNKCCASEKVPREKVKYSSPENFPPTLDPQF